MRLASPTLIAYRAYTTALNDDDSDDDGDNANTTVTNTLAPYA